MDLLTDVKLYREIESQIRKQLIIALSFRKEEILFSNEGSLLQDYGVCLAEKCLLGSVAVASCVGEDGPTTPDNVISSDDNTQAMSVNTEDARGEKMANNKSNIVRIKLRLRQENIVIVDEFDYDINSSGVEGGCPFSLANSIAEDLKLPPEFAPSIAASIVEQIYGVEIPKSVEGLGSGYAQDGVTAAFTLDVTREGSTSGLAQMILDSS